MRILILADIHANWPALQAISETFDACLFLGDLVDYGTNPAPCVNWIRQHATAAVRGNHDHAVAQRVPARTGSGFRNLAAATRPIQYDALTPDLMQFLADLPISRTVRLNGRTFHLVHATPHDPLDEYLFADRRGWLNRLESVDADIVCVGHSHSQFHLDLDGIQVLNPGSVGQPRDGDPRCAYAIVDDGRVELKRVEYDVNATIDHMRSCGIDDQMLKFAEFALRTGGRIPAESPAAKSGVDFNDPEDARNQ